jgi:hypothetical protein
MTKHLFVVTSAINSRFGIYKPNERLKQTIDTIDSIRSRIPDAGIAIMECTGVPLTAEQEQALREHCDYFLDYTTHPEVQAMYKSTDNWDIVKNGTEIRVFSMALEVLKNNKIVDNYDRVHKMSGRYLLNTQFVPGFYDLEHIQDQIIIGKSQASQFPPQMTLVERQYMARLWSWPANLNDEIIKVYQDSFNYFMERINAGGYVDIEHVLYKFLNREHLTEVDFVGVQGTIAPNGAGIQN